MIFLTWHSSVSHVGMVMLLHIYVMLLTRLLALYRLCSLPRLSSAEAQCCLGHICNLVWKGQISIGSLGQLGASLPFIPLSTTPRSFHGGYKARPGPDLSSEDTRAYNNASKESMLDLHHIPLCHWCKCFHYEPHCVRSYEAKDHHYLGILMQLPCPCMMRYCVTLGKWCYPVAHSISNVLYMLPTVHVFLHMLQKSPFSHLIPAWGSTTIVVTLHVCLSVRISTAYRALDSGGLGQWPSIHQNRWHTVCLFIASISCLWKGWILYDTKCLLVKWSFLHFCQLLLNATLSGKDVCWTWEFPW